MSVSAVGARTVTALDGLGSSAMPLLLQHTFVDEQAKQFGYCINIIDLRRSCATASAALPARCGWPWTPKWC